MNRLTTLPNTEAARPHAIPNRLRASLLQLAMLLAAAAALSGCATPDLSEKSAAHKRNPQPTPAQSDQSFPGFTVGLWKMTAGHNWNPQSIPAQFLAVTTTGRQDVIFVFRQGTQLNGKMESRVVAWNVARPASELAIGEKAVRRLTNHCDRVQLMPSFNYDAVPGGLTTTSPGYVVLGPPLNQFTVRLDGVPAGPFQLPSTNQKTQVTFRVIGLPPAVALDAALLTIALLAMGGGVPPM